jgi:hypothetical protein
MTAARSFGNGAAAAAAAADESRMIICDFIVFIHRNRVVVHVILGVRHGQTSRLL